MVISCGLSSFCPFFETAKSPNRWVSYLICALEAASAALWKKMVLEMLFLSPVTVFSVQIILWRGPQFSATILAADDSPYRQNLSSTLEVCH